MSRTHDTLDKLVCSDGTWRSAGASCDGDYRCDTRLGSTQGTCQAIAALCTGEQAGTMVCDGATRRRCDADLLRYEAADCPDHAQCVATGGVHCECLAGYADDGAGGCANIDECVGEPCGASPNACADAVGGYSCSCGAGFTPVGTTGCADIDECLSNRGGCDALVSCGNVPGGRTCGACPVGYRGAGDTGCVPLWTQQFGTALADVAYGVVTDASGNVYAAASSAGELGAANPGGANDMLVVKLNGAGQRQWARQLGSGAVDTPVGIVIDADANVYVAGTTGGDLDGSTSVGGSDVYVTKYDAAGDKVWTQQLGSLGDETATSVAGDASGNVYVTGFTFGGLEGNNRGGLDLFVAKVNATGAMQWVRQLGSVNWDYAWAAATDVNGNVYVIGSAGGAFDVAPTLAPGLEIIVKYDGAGQRQWIRTFDPGNGLANAAAVDAQGNLYLAGHTLTAFDGHTSAGGYDLFVIKFDAAGTQAWSRQLGTGVDDMGEAMAVSAAGEVYLTGYTKAALDGQPHAGSDDLFVVKYDGAGQKQWTRQLGTAGEDRGHGITVTDSGIVFVAGGTYGALDGNSPAGDVDAFVVKYDSAGNRL